MAPFAHFALVATTLMGLSSAWNLGLKRGDALVARQTSESLSMGVTTGATTGLTFTESASSAISTTGTDVSTSLSSIIFSKPTPDETVYLFTTDASGSPTTLSSTVTASASSGSSSAATTASTSGSSSGTATGAAATSSTSNAADVNNVAGSGLAIAALGAAMALL